MVIVLKKDISSSDRKKIDSFLAEKNFKINEILGEERTVIAAVGRAVVPSEDVLQLSGVDSVIPISKPYKLASREFRPENTVISLNSSETGVIRIGGQRIAAFAGPCAVESREQIFAIASEVASSGACVLRGGAFQPRTSPYAFHGLGEEGVRFLKEAGDAYSMPVLTEVMAEEQIPLMQKYGVDAIMIGARNMQNFDLLKAVGKLKKPVVLKRSYSATIEELLMSAEYLLSAGTEQVILCERGIRTFEKAVKNTLDLSCVPVLKSLTHLPVIVDPSHALGVRDKVPPMALAAVACGADGIIVEVHDNPAKALVDGPQALLPEMFDKLMHDVEALSPVLGKTVVHLPKTSSVDSHKKEKPATESSQIICAYSGKRGAYAEQAVNRYFEQDVKALSMDSFRAVFSAVLDGKADFGMIPIENSLAGSVYENYDNLSVFEDISIVGALHLRIQHALLAPKGATLSSIKRVYSHPQGFAQCSKLLSKYKWEKISTVSTATGAKMVSESASKENAAIASAITAKYYDLAIIQEEVEDDPRDYTRFVVIASNRNKKINTFSAGANKASFMFCVKNETGALYDCLGIFQKHGINLTRLESRPVAGQPWHYWFYADAELLEKQQNMQYVQNIIEELKNSAQNVRLLGVYSEARWGI